MNVPVKIEGKYVMVDVKTEEEVAKEEREKKEAQLRADIDYLSIMLGVDFL